MSPVVKMKLWPISSYILCSYITTSSIDMMQGNSFFSCKRYLKVPQIYWNLLKQSSLVMAIALNSLVSPFMCRRDEFIPLHVTNLISGIMLGFGGVNVLNRERTYDNVIQ